MHPKNLHRVLNLCQVEVHVVCVNNYRMYNEFHNQKKYKEVARNETNNME